VTFFTGAPVYFNTGPCPVSSLQLKIVLKKELENYFEKDLKKDIDKTFKRN